MSQDFVFLQKSNIEEFYYIFNDAFNDDIQNKSIDMESFRENLINHNIKNEVSFLIKDDGKPQGLFLGTIRGNKGYISSIAVSKQFRKLGYGQILLEKGISLMEDYNCRKIILEVKDDNKNAINLYFKAGFKISNTIYNYKYESNIIFNELINNNYKLNETDSFSYQLLYNTFHKEKLPWQKSFNGIYEKLNNKKARLYTFLLNDLTAGYIAVSNNDNTINIEDIGLKDYDLNTLKLIFSLILQNKINMSLQNKINLLANNYYKNDPFCPLLEETGFHLYIKQLEMEKRLI